MVLIGYTSIEHVGEHVDNINHQSKHEDGA